MAFGLIVLLVGIWLLSVQLFPALRSWERQFSTWPMIVIGAGGLLLALGLFTRDGNLMMPGCIVATVGGILMVNYITNNYFSWTYAWTLIPGGAGVGQVLAGMINADRQRVNHGLNTIATSILLFIIFAAFFGGLTWLGPYWPVFVIVAGLWLLVRAFWRK
jgi:hypothetical protein